MKTTSPKRIESIDILRGIVMIIMALDHVRDYFHISSFTEDPLNLTTTTPALYFTRWITHFCAPIFVFLSGMSIYLQGLRKTKKELSVFLIKRGLWLIFAEVAIVTLGLSFNPLYNVLMLQVIWAIGCSMAILGLLIYLPFNVILGLGLVIVLGHNLLDTFESASDFKANFWWDLLHHAGGPYQFAPSHFVITLYPLIPWTGLMMLGYCAGIFYSKAFSVEQRSKTLTWLGIGLILFFVGLRFVNSYGNPFAWSVQKSSLFTVFSFINVQKYPPSLLYMCITIGPALILLAWIEKIQNGFTKTIRIYGRTAFFYYLIHFYLIHLLSALCFFGRGHSMQDAINIATSNSLPFLFIKPGEGFNLSIIYLIWIAVVVSLYPLCKWYDAYKTKHKEKWWLSYL